MKATILLAMLIVSLAQVTAPSLTVGFLPSYQTKDPSINSFWAKFKAAVLKGDKTLVADMSHYPVEMSYGIAPIRNRTQFIRHYREIFSEQADARKCFAEAKPVVEANDRKRFSVGCKEAAGNEVVIYAFVRTQTGWKFKSLDNINE
jgi:hypothetical protein